MTANKRIFLNIVATYGRSLFALLCGVFTGRWVLLSLGEVDYGLYGLVAGLTGFISFFNSLLASAIGRFYALSVGAQSSASDRSVAVEETRAWFNTAISIHTAIPLLLVFVGYPIGCWVIRTVLSIPLDRIADCIWIFRFVCLTCFVGMASVPFTAMYTAKQYIAELTIYSFVTTTVNVIFLYYMITHPGVWLVKYGIWTCLIQLVPSAIILMRAMVIFPECRVRRSLLFKFDRFRQLGVFAGWQSIGAISSLLRIEGMSVVVNIFFGPRANAAMTVGGSINGHANSLAGSMFAAMSPAITNAYGAGDMMRMKQLVFMVCRFCVLLSMVFAIPLILEMRTVLEIWLKNPPHYAAEFAILFLIQLLLENSTVGHMIAVNATGKIALYQVAMGAISLLALPIAYVWMRTWGNPCVSVLSIIVTIVFYSILRLWFAQRLVGLSMVYWIRHVFIPLVFIAASSFGIGWLPVHFIVPSFGRIIITTVCCEIVFMPLTWFVLLTGEERSFLMAKLGPKIERFMWK